MFGRAGGIVGAGGDDLLNHDDVGLSTLMIDDHHFFVLRRTFVAMGGSFVLQSFAEEPIDIGQYPPVKDKNGNLVLAPEAATVVNDVEARVEALMLGLGSKAGTQNVDRILHLPGTTNVPNATKREKARSADVQAPTVGATRPMLAARKPIN